jgi:hypothetical protein
MVPVGALPHFGFCFNFGGESFGGDSDFSGDGFSFPAAPEHFSKHVHDPPAGSFQVEQKANNSRHRSLPNQCAKAGINVSE